MNKSIKISKRKARWFYIYPNYIYIFFRYILNPNDDNRDNNYLLTNGSIYAPNHDPKMLQPGINYCAEIVPGLGLHTFVCFSESKQKYF